MVLGHFVCLADPLDDSAMSQLLSLVQKCLSVSALSKCEWVMLVFRNTGNGRNFAAVWLVLSPIDDLLLVFHISNLRLGHLLSGLLDRSSLLQWDCDRWKLGSFFFRLGNHALSSREDNKGVALLLHYGSLLWQIKLLSPASHIVDLFFSGVAAHKSWAHRAGIVVLSFFEVLEYRFEIVREVEGFSRCGIEGECSGEHLVKWKCLRGVWFFFLFGFNYKALTRYTEVINKQATGRHD